MYEDTWFPASIIDEIAKFPHFQQKVREYWPHFYGDIYLSLDDYIQSAKPIKPGIYILRTKTKSGEVKTRKVIY